MKVQTKDGQEFDPRSDEFNELTNQGYKNKEDNNVQKLIKALQIFDEAGISYLPGADHDVIYGPSPYDLTLDQVKKLYTLGWHYDTSIDTMCQFV